VVTGPPVAAAPPPTAPPSVQPAPPLETATPASAPAGSLSVAPPIPPADIPLWARIVRSPAVTPVLRAILTNSTLVELKDTAAVLNTAPRFLAGAKSRLSEIAALFEKELGRRIEVTIQEPEAPSPDSPASESPATSSAPPSPVEDPLVKIAMDLFNARIVSVQPRHP
jgi:hypothetical protein